MALPPTIPTSFVPHAPERRFRTDLTGAFGFFAYAVLGVVFILAVMVFFYGRILASSLSAKDAKLAEAVGRIDQTTVEGFVQLRDRLVSSKTLLNGHVAFSNLFSFIEKIVPTTVRFESLNLAIDATGVPKMGGSGIAKDFNALAVASATFATDGRIKDAIFSNIAINKDGSVSFTFASTLDPKIIAFSP